ncbi:MAG: DCL family protein [Anaerolineales bacterium]|nr:DCL family protein [Anaerolineales bacterium]
MGKRESYVIAGEIFSTKYALQERIKKILYRYQDEQYLSDNDFEFMFQALNRHLDFEIKKGIGIKAFFVRQNPVYKNTRCFWLVCFDGSETDFSYQECLKPTSQEKKFFNACRVAIEPYTQEYKRKFFDDLNGKTYFCPYTNQPLNFKGSHVDHKAPNTFQQIVITFLKKYAIDISNVKINSSAIDNKHQDTFSDSDLEQLWVEYHNSQAVFQIISRKANLGLPKR